MSDDKQDRAPARGETSMSEDPKDRAARVLREYAADIDHNADAAALARAVLDLSAQHGMGRWCPACGEWLADPAPIGAGDLAGACGTCMSKIELHPISNLRIERDALCAEVERLRERQQEHLRLIRTISTEAIPEGEADELRGQIAALIAEVGTLRSAIKEWRTGDLYPDGAFEVLDCLARALDGEGGQQRCPTCASPSPHLHPALQHEGEVQVCRDSWHTKDAPDGEGEG